MLQQENEPRSLIQSQMSPIRQPSLSRKPKTGKEKRGVPFSVDIPLKLDQKPPDKAAKESIGKITSPQSRGWI